ncbi:type II toxin-antitoxin system RelE/ParE family toxin [Thermanaerosceptrum fracticalcis]|uniref:Type II toxin-antitoxin system RelE/ParE family toxin n=1 Tax=Thermanaerosceptrum fracticalcis TaxID=1712410 RepID=A0A7G6E058_THEFR|nr:type II toxin-antitoxin system RelE/ParE family toxin [Thermanaerosceptrum fracticalcis]QNB45462.1 type II toxin-antitoxin system RelE/ParE family toxin [Thermanaerosceptrum fracticalcis]
MLPVQYLPQAEKYLKKIRDPQLKRRFKEAIDNIRKNPQVGKAKKYDLAGIMGYDIYYKNTNYEIAYKVVEIEGKTVLIILAGTRENFYDELKKYLKKQR